MNLQCAAQVQPCHHCACHIVAADTNELTVRRTGATFGEQSLGLLSLGPMN